MKLNTLILLASIIFVIKDFSNNSLNISTILGFDALYMIYVAFSGIMIIPMVLYIPIYLLIATRHRVSKIVRKFTGQKVAITSVSILLIFIIIIILTAILAKNSRFLIIDELLICVSLLLVFTDNLMLKNDVTIIEDYSKLNMLKNKLQDDRLFQDRDIEQVILWGKYLAYSVAFGTSTKIAKRMKELHIDDDLEKLLEDKTMFDNICYGYNEISERRHRYECKYKRYPRIEVLVPERNVYYKHYERYDERRPVIISRHFLISLFLCFKIIA